MNNILEMAGAFLAAYPVLRFLAVALAIVVNGEAGIVLFIYFAAGDRSGWLWFFLTAFVAIVLAETFTYFLGYFLRGTTFGKRMETRIKNHDKIERYLHNNSTCLMILSKFVIYLSLGVVFLSGWTRVGFRRFLKLRIAAIFVWLVLMLAVIYGVVSVFGAFGTAVVFRRIEFGIAVAVLVVISGELFFKKRIERAVMGE